jgi:hypothetical protein
MEWQRATARYEALGYYVAQRANDSVIMEYESSFSVWVFIVLFLLCFLCGIAYLIVGQRKTYRMTLQQNDRGEIDELGFTAEKFEENKKKLNTITWILFAISLCVSVCAILNLLGR